MNVLKNILLIFTAVLILLPSGVSFSHLFSDHGHSLCDNYADEHYHDKSLDCELHKFQKNPIISLDFHSFQFEEAVYTSALNYDYYQFLNDYEPLCYELRGPPAIST